MKTVNSKSLIDTAKNRFKRYPRLYYFIVLFLGPMLYQNKAYKSLFKLAPGNEPILNLGSGPMRLSSRKNIINLDFCHYKNVDVIANANRISFKDNSMGGLINIALLEHIENPEAVIKEIYRVLKPGGYACTVTPFMYGFHASPNDYYRWTREGIKKLFSAFEEIDSGNHSGPTSALLSILQEWLALVFSLQNKYLYQIFWVFFMVLLAPFKIIDFYLSRHPEAHKTSASIYYICRKPIEQRV